MKFLKPVYWWSRRKLWRLWEEFVSLIKWRHRQRTRDGPNWPAITQTRRFRLTEISVGCPLSKPLFLRGGGGAPSSYGVSEIKLEELQPDTLTNQTSFRNFNRGLRLSSQKFGFDVSTTSVTITETENLGAHYKPNSSPFNVKRSPFHGDLRQVRQRFRLAGTRWSRTTKTELN